MRHLKDKEILLKGKLLEILDKCSATKEIATFKVEIAKLLDITGIFNNQSQDDPKLLEALIAEIKKRHDSVQSIIQTHICWIDDEKFRAKYIVYADLPAEIQDLKKLTAMVILDKHQQILPKLRNTEVLLVVVLFKHPL